ncbi:MAG: hypothetical protein U9M89_02855 [Patescibacteria group bacterium]|nr:hypothetical protein [Patescibacteria group bacterium]
MKIFEQREWHGIAKKSPGRNDELTSQIEINTEPGEDYLKRLNSKKPYLSNVMPAPAAYFGELGGYYMLKGNSSDPNYGYGGATNAPDINMGFKFDDLAPKATDDIRYIARAYDAANEKSAWDIGIKYTGTAWRVYIMMRKTISITEEITIAQDLDVGEWYWLYLSYNHSQTRVEYELYDVDSTKLIDTSTSLSGKTFPGDYNIYLGGYPKSQTDSFYGGSISFFGVGTIWSFSGSQTGKPWQSWNAGLDAWSVMDATFTPRDTRKSIIPAEIDSSTDKNSWVYFPRPGITQVEASAGDTLDATGLYAENGYGYLLDMTGKDVFSQKTVFMFNYDVDDEAVLLRSRDCNFAIYHTAGELAVYWTPSDFSLGDDERCGQALCSVDESDLGSTDDLWIAVEIDPTNEIGEDNINIYQWSGSHWATLSPTGTTSGSGIIAPDSTQWAICQTYEGTMSLYDFRVIVGDSSWQTNHDGDSPTERIPTGTICWMNMNQDGTFHKDENAKTLSFPKNGDYVTGDFALSDRVDGVFRYTSPPALGWRSWNGVPDQLNSFQTTVEDMQIDGDENINAVTDAYWYKENSDPWPLKASRTMARRQISSVGTHRYVTGAAPFQRAGDSGAIVGIHPPWVMPYLTSKNASTLDYEGFLDWATEYKFKVTIQDTITGNETNPYGYYRFTTDADPGTGSTYGDEGCGFLIYSEIRTNQDLQNCQANFYRYESGSGVYRYEGSSNISGWSNRGDYYTATTAFAFGLSTTSLAARTAIEDDNDEVPRHTYSTIWGSRSWFIDAENPSRVRFSKPFFLGNCPLTQVVWTDEGLTGDILGMIPGFGGLLLLKERSIWIIPYSDTADGFLAQQLIPNSGVVSADAAIFVEGALWYASDDGIHVFDGEKLTNVSESLDGADRFVWEVNPRKTKAWYDKRNWKIVFSCDGAAISFNSRNGGASISGCPDSCYLDISTSGYSGALYGSDGMIWKNDSESTVQTLDFNGTTSSENHGPVDTTDSTISDIDWYWTDGEGNSGSERIGIDYDTDLTTEQTSSWLGATTDVQGRIFTQWSKTDGEIWAASINVVGAQGKMCFKTIRDDLDYFFIDKFPVYYKGQFVYFLSRAEMKITELLELVFGDTNDSDAQADISFVAETIGENTTTNTTSVANTTLSVNDLVRIPIQSKCYRGYYTFESDTTSDLPPLRDLRLHYSSIRPRGGGRR